MLKNISFSQINPLKGTVFIRKPVAVSSKSVLIKRGFTNRENPLKGKWVLKEHRINNKQVSPSENTHFLEFYDSTYRFRRIYEQPKSKVFEGAFPVGTLRNKINGSEDSVIKFKKLIIRNYHLLFEEDSLVVTDLVNMNLHNFTYSKKEITFVVKEYDINHFLIRTLYFVYAKTED